MGAQEKEHVEYHPSELNCKKQQKFNKAQINN